MDDNDIRKDGPQQGPLVAVAITFGAAILGLAFLVGVMFTVAGS